MKKNKMKSILFVLPAFAATVMIFSCSKEKDTDEAPFYGLWATSYGDTIRFYKLNGKSMIAYNNSMNPSPTAVNSYEFAYMMNKLLIKDGMPGARNFRVLQTFRWIQEGRSFEVLGIEWFMFISSSTTRFTFTKIP